MSQTPDNNGPETKLRKRLAKLAKKLDELLTEEVEAEDESQLKARIVRCQMNLAVNNTAKEADEKLSSCREELKELGAPYRETASHQKAVQEYATILLRLKEL